MVGNRAAGRARRCIVQLSKSRRGEGLAMAGGVRRDAVSYGCARESWQVNKIKRRVQHTRIGV